MNLFCPFLLFYLIFFIPLHLRISLAKRCTVIGSVFATLNVRSKAMPKEEMIVCKMNGVFPELFGKCDVTSCISVYMKCLKESEKCLLRN